MADRAVPPVSNQAASPWAARVAIVLGLAVAGVGLVKGTRAVGGSDSSCYGLMADAFAGAAWQPTTPRLASAPWPDVSRTLAPAGFLPSPVRADAASPVCAPGFSLFLAPFIWLGGRDGIFAVTPIAGGVLVWLAFLFGRQLAGSATGVAGALVTATLPVLLFQVVQPMNDVLVAALWMAIVTAASLPEPSRAWALGSLAGLAVLVRPNLALSAAVVATWLVAVTVKREGCTPMLARTAVGFAIASAPFVITLFVLNTILYGHPLRTGYGQVGDLFSLTNVDANVRHYGTAIAETQLGFPLLGLAALVVAPRRVRAVAWLAVVVSGTVAGVYLLYRPFPEWWYLRFLLPALVPLTVLACAALTWVLSSVLRAPRAGRGVALTIAVALGLFQTRVAGDRQVFDLQRLERRFRTTGEVVRDRLPGNAVFISVWESGTVRFHADREAVLWDSLAPGSLDDAIAWLMAHGREPLLLFEQWEEPTFRQRFTGHSAVGELDWPPRFEIERQVRIYSPRDRTTFRQGANIATEFVIPR